VSYSYIIIVAKLQIISIIIFQVIKKVWCLRPTRPFSSDIIICPTKSKFRPSRDHGNGSQRLRISDILGARTLLELVYWKDEPRVSGRISYIQLVTFSQARFLWDSSNTTQRLVLTHRTSLVYPITDLWKDGPLGWWCDYVTPYRSKCWKQTFESQTPDRFV